MLFVNKVLKATQLFCIAFLFTAELFANENNNILYSWTQAAPNNMLSIRVIMAGTQDCPDAMIDNKVQRMEFRSATQDILVCSLGVNRKAKKISVAGNELPSLAQNIKKIAIIGDTGCWVPQGENFKQSCNAEVWPLSPILDNIAQHNPDLVLHVGDYIYSYNDQSSSTWDSWKNEWFAASDKLSRKVPFLFVRGNHEKCDLNRNIAGCQGWFDFLDSGTASHQDFSDLWSFYPTKNMKFFVLDSSYGDDSSSGDRTNPGGAQQNSYYNDALAEMNQGATDTWLLTHRPLWAVAGLALSPEVRRYGNFTQCNIFEGKFANHIKAVLSGHVHIGQVLAISDNPTQLIVGHTAQRYLDRTIDNNNIFLDGIGINYQRSISGHGFAIYDLRNNEISFYDLNNNKMYSYVIE